MRETKLFYIVILLVYTYILTGCVSYPDSIGDIMATSHSDLDKPRDTDIAVTFNASKESLFDQVITIMKDNKLIAYQKDKRKDFIIAMGFPKQTNTTQVGIYFKSDKEGVTRVTLTSLSATCLKKAEAIIMMRLKSNNSTL